MVSNIAMLTDFNPENAKEFNQETLYGQHLLVCGLQELGCMLLSLGTTSYSLLSDQPLGKYRPISLATITCI